MQQIHTVDGVLHPSFKAACLALGLLDDDGEWNQCLADAANIQTGHQPCYLFAMILEHCIPTQPEVLWETYRTSIYDDLKRVLMQKYQRYIYILFLS
jgi:hypothetical protein